MKPHSTAAVTANETPDPDTRAPVRPAVPTSTTPITATTSSTAIPRPSRSPKAIAIAAAAAPSQEMIGVTTEIGHRANAL